MRTLIFLRVALVVGQCLMLLAVWRLLRWPVPFAPCLGLIGLSAMLSAGLALSPAARREAQPWEVLSLMAFDIAELTLVLQITGGVLNPFALLLIAPVTVAGAALRPRTAVMVCAAGLAAALFLTFAPGAVSADPAAQFESGYRLARLFSLEIAIVFASAYATWSAAEASRRQLALNITETVLAREQRLSALGALAAAAAHELGTPLATIAIVATELVRDAPEGPLREDAVLLVEQARRCRDILKRLAETPERRDAVHERLTLLQLVREIVEPYAAATDVRVEALVTGPPGVAAPDIWRRPEILHAIAAIVENAFDFANGEILVTARFDVGFVSLEVRDDGPGFAPAIMTKLGEPYVTSRPGAEGSRTGHIGMGLGFFIAKTLLERTGARVHFQNAPRSGAIVTARWPRLAVEALG